MRQLDQKFCRRADTKPVLNTGHKTIDCTENRKFDQNDVPDKLPEEAWDMMKKAAAEKDLEDFREVSENLKQIYNT